MAGVVIFAELVQIKILLLIIAHYVIMIFALNVPQNKFIDSIKKFGNISESNKIKQSINVRSKILGESVTQSTFTSIYLKAPVHKHPLEIIKDSHKLPNKIKISLEKGKEIENNWNNNTLHLLINN